MHSIVISSLLQQWTKQPCCGKLKQLSEGKSLRKMLFFLLSITPSYDPLRDPIWQFVGVVVAVAFGLITVVSVIITLKSYRQQQREVELERTAKELIYEIISIAPIATINKSVVDRVKILFDGKPVENLYLLILQIKNDGNTAIKPEDYSEPLQVIFKENQIISGDILETSPRNLIDDKALKTFLDFEINSIKLSKILLNPSESISIKVLLKNKNSNIEIRARIADCRIIDAKEVYIRRTEAEWKRERLRTRNFNLMSAIMLIMILPICILFIYDDINHILSPLIMNILFGFTMISCLFLIMKSSSILKKRVKSD